MSSSDDDFGTTSRLVRPRVVDETYPYHHRNPWWRLVSAILYYVVAPLVACYIIAYYGIRIRNRAEVRRLHGCYMYGTHSHWVDFALPYLMAFPRRAYLTGGPTGFSIPGVKHLVAMMGGVPLNTTEAGKAKFRQFLTDAIAAGQVVAMLPEGHLWPYFTGVRDYPSYAFTYPVRDSNPVLGYAVTYRQRRWLKFRPPCLTVTISPAIQPEFWQGSPDPKQKLRDAVHGFMCETVRAQNSFSWIDYTQSYSAQDGQDAL